MNKHFSKISKEGSGIAKGFRKLQDILTNFKKVEELKTTDTSVIAMGRIGR